MSKTAIITGIGGMDGFYLSRMLLRLGYRVVGILRRSANPNDTRLRTLKGSPNLHLVYGDITDPASISRVVQEFQPDEFYHLAANSFVGSSWNSPAHYIETNTIGTINCLEALRQFSPECHFYFAGSSEMYGDYVKRQGGDVILDEDSPMIAASPYGVSKVAGYQMTKLYRESYGMFATCGILFNHSDTLRGQEFFTRKVTNQIAKIHWGKQDKIMLGNLDAKRDEGASRDYVSAMHAMLQHDNPDDFVIATGETHSCREWLENTLQFFDLKEDCVEYNVSSLVRPNEVNVLIGNANKARELLGWSPETDYRELNSKMCKYDYYLESSEPQHTSVADQWI